MFRRRAQLHVDWVPVDPRTLARAEARFRVARGEGVQPLRVRTMTEALLELGAPQLPHLTPEREAIELLKYGAEVEHGLMAQYLYAMYSSRNAAIQGTLKRIAIEEMGHLITVLNLLAVAGEAPHVDRYDWSDGTFEPFPFRLEPVSRQTIAKYTACEMPDVESATIEPAQRELLEQILADARASAGVDPARIGLLYVKIYWLIRESDHPLPDPTQEPWNGFPVEAFANSAHAGRHVAASFFHSGTAHQAKPEDWRGNQDNVIVSLISDRAAALAAVAAISEQGEGFGDAPQGHFDQFVEAYRIAKDGTDLARPVPTDPWYQSGRAPRGEPVDEITSADGKGFARLSDQLYELVLLSITLHYLLPQTVDPMLRAGVAQAALLLMTDCVAKAGRALVEIERDPGQPSPPNAVAHMCFSRPEPVPDETPGDVHARILALIEESATTADEIAASTQKILRRTSARTISTRLRSDVKPMFEQIMP